MHEEKIEAIVIRSQDYQERHRLITLYSPLGILSMLIKNISKKNGHLLTLSSVFTHGEYLFCQNQSDLTRFIDGTVLNEHLHLRHNLSSIQTAAKLTQIILSTQLPGKPAFELFALYKTYLKQIHFFPNPSALLCSFQLKLLKHEGLLHLEPFCAHCKNSSATAVHLGESVCLEHAATPSHLFTPNEWKQLLSLYSARNFSELHSLSVLSSLPVKMETLFTSRFLDQT